MRNDKQQWKAVVEVSGTPVDFIAANRLILTIKRDGSVEFGPGIDPPAAAREFWELFADMNPLKAEVERLRAELSARQAENRVVQQNFAALQAENAALRAIVQAVADLEPEMRDGDSFPSDPGYHVDALIRQARTLLAAQ